MRVLPLGVVIAISVFLGVGVASAEKVRTNQTTTLLARPGEQAKHLLTVKSGQNMTLLSQDGRWLKVRVNGRTGYVPRSKVDMDDDTGIARNTRRRSFVDGRGKKRGVGGEAPDDRVGADATGETGTGDEGDSSDEEDEPKPKKAPAKAAPAKAAASKGKQEEDDEDDDEEEDVPPPKKAAPPPKAAAKATPAKPAAKASDEDDEEDDEEEGDEKPAPKTAPKVSAKTAPKAAAKPAGKGDDEEDDEEEDTGDDEEKPSAKKAASSPSDEDEEDEAPIKKKESSDDREVVHVLKTSKIHEKPDSESDDKFVARPTDMLFPKETKGGWTHVENDEGDSGWVESDQLETGGGAAAGKPAINIGARVGLTIIQQGMRTSGSNVLEVPDNYNIGTSAGTLSLGGGVLFPRGKALLGAEFTYDYAKALGGGVAFDPDGTDGPMPVARIGITLHNVNVRGIAGLDFKKKNGMALLGHLGYRYQGFLVADYADFAKNPARLPSEVVKGPTLGAAFVIPRITDKIGIRFSLDAMLFGASVKQTVGLEDGASPSAKAIVVGTGFTYRLKAIELAAAYDLNYMGIDFGAPVAASMRNHMGTNVTRTDIFHMVTFGIAKPF